jgi:hypothetical protein
LDATTEAAILLHAEVPARQEQLRDLITCEATKIANQQCNALRNEIKNIKKNLNPKSSKKDGRGLPRKQGASPKKIVGTDKHPVQETATHHCPKSPISQETKAMDGLPSQVTTVAIEIFNANHNHIIISRNRE